MPTTGQMKVELAQDKAITGRGALESDSSGQVWFDYSDRPFPSKIDWRSATTLTFVPDLGKSRSWLASDVEYFYNGGWVGPRLVLERAHRG